MSRPQASTRVDKQKIIAAIVLLLIVGYVVGRPTFERWLGRPLPVFGFEGHDQPGTDADRPEQPGRTDSTGRTGLPSDEDANRTRSPQRPSDRPSGTDDKAADRSSNAGQGASATTEEFFQPAGGRRLQSPAGLVYGMGPGGEHRCDHVLLHAADDPSRGVHGVFEGTDAEIFALIDEAWRLAQKGGRGVQKRDADDGRVEYTVRLNRAIGYEGGQQGRRNDHPKLNRLKLIVEDGNELITAYPVR